MSAPALPPADDGAETPVAEALARDHERLHRLAARVTGSAADADDVLQGIALRLTERRLTVPSSA